jgi:hypothetical protein
MLDGTNVWASPLLWWSWMPLCSCRVAVQSVSSFF